MIDYARPLDNMHPAPDPMRLEDFQVFNKKWTVPYSYGDYYSGAYAAYEPEIEAAASTYHDLVAPEYPPPGDAWRHKPLELWAEDDTLYWLLDALREAGAADGDVAFHNFKMPGAALRGLSRAELQQRLLSPLADPAAARAAADAVWERLRHLLQRDPAPPAPPAARYDGYFRDEPHAVLHDLDARGGGGGCAAPGDSSDDAEGRGSAEPASPEWADASDASKSGDEDDRRRVFKRPPGRPKGSGKKQGGPKRGKSVSVPEFLRNLLLDPEFCPGIIKWEDYHKGMFRFVKPDEVAKLWGHMKQNGNMTFEKFSRAMRYHYRQAVLVSVPTARLVYQFGVKGPDYRTDNPNFARAKPEPEMCSDLMFS